MERRFNSRLGSHIVPWFGTLGSLLAPVRRIYRRAPALPIFCPYCGCDLRPLPKACPKCGATIANGRVSRLAADPLASQLRLAIPAKTPEHTDAAPAEIPADQVR